MDESYSDSGARGISDALDAGREIVEETYREDSGQNSVANVAKVSQ